MISCGVCIYCCYLYIYPLYNCGHDLAELGGSFLLYFIIGNTTVSQDGANLKDCPEAHGELAGRGLQFYEA